MGGGLKIKPKNWERFQHYKERDPPWIKLHCKLLDDVTFQRLPRASQALAPMLWLLAAGQPEAIIDANPEDLAFRLRWPERELTDALSPLIGKGFFEVVQFDSTLQASCTPETYTPEAESENKPLLSGKPDGGRRARIKTEALEYLDFLNAKAGKHFRPVPSNLRFIEARLASGISLQDLKTLTVRKCREWLGTDQEKFLRPETLCNPTKCHSYLGAIPPEETPCNVPDVIARSKLELAPAPAGGSRPINSPPQDPIRTLGDVLGLQAPSSATTPGPFPTPPGAKALGTADTTFSQAVRRLEAKSSGSLAYGEPENPFPIGSAPLH